MSDVNDAAKYMTDTIVSLEDLANFEYDGVNYLYDLEPQQNNLFWAGNFNDGKAGNENFAFHNSQFRIQKIVLKMPNLKFEVHPQLRVPLIKAVEFSRELKIQFVEDVYHSVQKYHFDWLCNFYNRSKDCLVNDVKGKFRKLDVVLFHYVNTGGMQGTASQYVEAPMVEKILSLEIGGMIPEDYGNFELDMKNDAGEQLVEMSYKISRCYLKYAKDLCAGTNGPGAESNPSKTLWSNQGQGGGDQKRMSRTLTPQKPGEGRLV